MDGNGLVLVNALTGLPQFVRQSMLKDLFQTTHPERVRHGK